LRATLILREKRIVVNRESGRLAIAELKIWRIPASKHYQNGRRFSLFLVVDGEIVIGIDNHSPKGPHLHLGDNESLYEYIYDSHLLEDFWDLVRKAGFDP